VVEHSGFSGQEGHVEPDGGHSGGSEVVGQFSAGGGDTVVGHSGFSGQEGVDSVDEHGGHSVDSVVVGQSPGGEPVTGQGSQVIGHAVVGSKVELGQFVVGSKAGVVGHSIGGSLVGMVVELGGQSEMEQAEVKVQL
jgi:hypothetical protein